MSLLTTEAAAAYTYRATDAIPLYALKRTPSWKSSPAMARSQAGDGSRAVRGGFRSTIPSAYNEEHLSLSEPVGIPAWGVFSGSFFVQRVRNVHKFVV